jgi:hypothetical protein
MPIVPAGYAVPRAPSVDPLAAAPDAAQQIRAPAGAFGALTGQALSQFGTAAERAATSWGNIQDRHDQVAADDLGNQLQDAVNRRLYGDPNIANDTGYLGLRGSDAMNARQSIHKELERVYQEHRSKLQNAQQQQVFDRGTRDYRNSALRQVSHHYDQQTTLYQENVAKAKDKNNEIAVNRSAQIDDDAAFAFTLGKRHRDLEEDGRARGLPPETVDAQKRLASQQATEARVEALAVADPAKAQRFADLNKELLGDKYPDLSNKLRARVEHQQTYSDVFGPAAGGVVVRNGPVEERINKAATAENISPRLAMTVASIESNFGQAADRAGSQYQGVYQLGRDAQAQVGGKDVEHGVRFLAQTRNQMTERLGRAPADWEVYLAHQQGTAGAAALLANPGQSAADALAPAYGGNRDQAARAIGANGGNPDAPASQFVQKWRNTYESRSAKLGAPGAAPSAATTGGSPAHRPPAAAGAPEPITNVVATRSPATWLRSAVAAGKTDRRTDRKLSRGRHRGRRVQSAANSRHGYTEAACGIG